MTDDYIIDVSDKLELEVKLLCPGAGGDGLKPWCIPWVQSHSCLIGSGG